MGGLFALNMVKYSIKKKIKVPTALLLTVPYPRLLFEDNNNDNNLLMAISDEEIESPHEIKLNQLQSVFLDLEINEIQKYEDDERLNFFISPKTVITIN